MIKLPAAALAVTLMMASAPGSTQAATAFVQGNFLHKVCQEAKVDPQESNCLTYVLGVADALAATQYSEVCIPSNSVSGGQLKDVVPKWLEDYPAQRHNPAVTLVGRALTEAFPCTE